MTPFRGAPWWEGDGFSGEDIRNSAEAFPFLAERSGAVVGGGLRRGIHLESFGKFWNVPAFHSEIKHLPSLKSFEKFGPFTTFPRPGGSRLFAFLSLHSSPRSRPKPGQIEQKVVEGRDSGRNPPLGDPFRPLFSLDAALPSPVFSSPDPGSFSFRRNFPSCPLIFYMPGFFIGN